MILFSSLLILVRICLAALPSSLLLGLRRRHCGLSINPGLWYLMVIIAFFFSNLKTRSSISSLVANSLASLLMLASMSSPPFFVNLVDLSLHEFPLPLLLHQVVVARLIRLDDDFPLSSHLPYVFREQFRWKKLTL